MRKLYSFLPVLFFPLFTTAQYLAHNDAPTSREYVTRTPPRHYWKPEERRVTGRPGKKQLSAMQKTTQAMLNYCRDSIFTETVASPSVAAAYYAEKNATTPYKFSVHCSWKASNTLTVTANDMSSLGERFVLNNQAYLVIPSPHQSEEACPYFETAVANNNTTTVNTYSKAWIITPDNEQLPYTPLTKKDYLQEAKTELTAAISKITATVQHNIPVRTAELQNADKQKAIEQLQRLYTGAALQVRMRNLEETYRSDEQTLQEGLERETAGFRKTLSLVDSLLQLPAEELAKPTHTTVAPSSFTGFNDSDSSHIIIKMNPDYFKAAIPAEKAQFLLVTWTCNEATTECAMIEKQLCEKFREPLFRRFLLR
ncbi:MAG: hypothetical protein QM731_02715 [Chitinophagaceae bacterium]